MTKKIGATVAKNVIVAMKKAKKVTMNAPTVSVGGLVAAIKKDKASDQVFKRLSSK